jgi:tetratricopeptide (TPR) repeat protein
MKTFELEPGETLEVLPPQVSALIKLKHYVVRLRHDLGIILVVTQAADHRAAITNVLEAAAAPRSAVITNCNFAIALATNSAGAYADRAQARERLGDYTGARADFDQALQSLRLGIPEPKVGQPGGTLTNYAGDPKAMVVATYASLYLRRAGVEYALQDWAAAQADCDQVLALQPNFSDAYRLRGMVRLYRHQDWLLALHDFNQAINLDPRNLAAYADHFVLMCQVGDTNAAAADREKALALDPKLAADPTWKLPGK